MGHGEGRIASPDLFLLSDSSCLSRRRAVRDDMRASNDVPRHDVDVGLRGARQPDCVQPALRDRQVDVPSSDPVPFKGRDLGCVRTARQVASFFDNTTRRPTTSQRNRSTLGGSARCQAGLNGRKVAASLGTASFP